MRRSGILMPVSSLPSEYGIGAFSKEAYEFVDFLEQAGQKLWQILPLGPTGYGDSPYQSFSTFAGNPYFIDLESLVKEGWITRSECDRMDFGEDECYIDYEKMYHSRFKLLKKAFDRSGIEENADYQAFVKENEFWLEDYALYMAIKDSLDGASFLTWDEDIKLRRKEAMEEYRGRLSEEIAFYKFQQFLFAKQWFALKDYANKKGIQIVGDIPIYVALDGADTWANPELFQLDEDCTPLAVAGCPPDAFSATGQLWGNPLYRWEYHKETGYEWWMKRIAYCYKLYDILRIDHFRGFDTYYAIPYGAKTAQTGEWRSGPGMKLFRAVKQALGDVPIVAEDLGELFPSVYELLAESGFPGMKVLQFAFGPGDSEYLPHNHPVHCVVYTGTHDNTTAAAWYRTAAPAQRKKAAAYLGLNREEGFAAGLVRGALASPGELCIIPLADYLALGAEARINTPSTLGGSNWVWRALPGQLCAANAKKIAALAVLYGRA